MWAVRIKKPRLAKPQEDSARNSEIHIEEKGTTAATLVKQNNLERTSVCHVCHPLLRIVRSTSMAQFPLEPATHRTPPSTLGLYSYCKAQFLASWRCSQQLFGHPFGCYRFFAATWGVWKKPDAKARDGQKWFQFKLKKWNTTIVLSSWACSVLCGSFVWTCSFWGCSSISQSRFHIICWCHASFCKK